MAYSELEYSLRSWNDLSLICQQAVSIGGHEWEGESNYDDDSTCRNVIYDSGIGIDDNRPRWCHAYSHVSAQKQKQPRDFYSNLLEYSRKVSQASL